MSDPGGRRLRLLRHLFSVAVVAPFPPRRCSLRGQNLRFRLAPDEGFLDRLVGQRMLVAPEKFVARLEDPMVAGLDRAVPGEGVVEML